MWAQGPGRKERNVVGIISYVKDYFAFDISLFKVTFKVNEYLNKCDCLPRAWNNT